MSSLNWSLHFGDLSEKDHVYFGHLFFATPKADVNLKSLVDQFFVVFGKPLVLG